MISLKSVTTEAVDTEDFVLLKKSILFSSIICDCKDRLKNEYEQRNGLVLLLASINLLIMDKIGFNNL